VNTWKRLTRRGGAKNTLPLNGTLEEELPNWDTFFVQAHGNLVNRLMIVPPNTYILNLATAGKSCNKIKWKIDNWIYEAGDASSVATGRRSTIKERLFRAIKEKTFFRGAEAGESKIYTPGTTSLNVEEQYTAGGTGGFSEVSLAFYEPGDIMFNTGLSFHNDYLPIVLLGAYNIPIPRRLRQQIFDINKIVYKPSANVNLLNAENIVGLPLANARAVARPEHDTMFNIPENILRTEMFPAGRAMKQDFLLSEVIDIVNGRNGLGAAAPALGAAAPPAAAGAGVGVNQKKHLFIVSACRSAATVDEAKRMRRFSIAARGNRERTAATPAEILANPAKQWRTKLTSRLLTNVRTQFENAIRGIEQKKREIRNKAVSDKRVVDATVEEKKRFAEKYKIEVERDALLAEKDAEIAAFQKHIQKIDQILVPGAQFTMNDITDILTAVSEKLQPEFKALLGIP
jgi:hypothetical protein